MTDPPSPRPLPSTVAQGDRLRQGLNVLLIVSGVVLTVLGGLSLARGPRRTVTCSLATGRCEWTGIFLNTMGVALSEIHDVKVDPSSKGTIHLRLVRRTGGPFVVAYDLQSPPDHVEAYRAAARAIQAFVDTPQPTPLVVEVPARESTGVTLGLGVVVLLSGVVSLIARRRSREAQVRAQPPT